jgi:outer membrane protein
MNSIRPLLAVFLSALLLVPAGLAQSPPPAAPAVVTYPDTSNLNKPQVPRAGGTGLWSSFSRDYRAADIAPINLSNTGRLESLIKAGKIYLSLDDCIAIALENNLDIELSRYNAGTAQADLLRAQAGGLLRGVSTSVSSAPTSALSQVTGGTGGNAGGSSSLTGGVAGGGSGGTVITQTGVAIPGLDPTFFTTGFVGHNSSPQSNTITTGTTALQFDNRAMDVGIQQSFLTNTSYTLTWNNNWVKSNNPLQDINPTWTPNLNLTVSQRLWQGWGISVNNRNIRVAKNNIKVTDLTFQQQVMTTVAGIVNLYWDLVSFVQDVKVKKTALEVARKFYSDNKKQVEIGTLAPIEIVRAEARVAQAQMDLTNSETAELQQETILKSALSKTGVASPTLADARVIPTDSLGVPGSDQFGTVGELTSLALRDRPDLLQTQLSIENTKIGIKGSKSQLLPSLDIQGQLQNNSLSGSINSVPPPSGITGPSYADPYFVGGYGNALAQIFRRNFPNYSIGFQLTVPIRNRTAQADYIRDELSLRQQQITAQKQVNDVRVNVQNAWISVVQAKARYESAVQARILQEQTLDATNKKYALGAATSFEVVQTQRDLAQAQGDEVAALAAYSRSKVQLDLSTAQILGKYHVEIAEAKAGKSSRPIQQQN